MKNNAAQQEVLLMTATRFASRQYSERDNPVQSADLPAKEKLKDYCWNGLLKDILPEVFLSIDPALKLYLWQLREANQFFALEMSEYPLGIDKSLSIDPYRFMEVQEYN
ncbi:MAG: hypothetical protein WKI04_05225 [Ferruginibacter sp.]